MNKKVLITGCARSGTKYITYILNELNFDVRHEFMGIDGIVSWLLADNSERPPWGPKEYDYKDFDIILHQVRNPINTISSCFTLNKRSMNYINKSLKIHNEKQLLEKLAIYWHKWNELAEAKSKWTYCIENISIVYPMFCKYLNVPIKEINFRTEMNTRKNNKKYTNILYEQIHQVDESLYHALVNQAKRYGYEDIV